MKKILQDPIKLFLIFGLILIIVAAIWYFKSNKSTATSITASKQLIFGNYLLILPQGFEEGGVVSSEIDPAFGVCSFEPEILSGAGTACKYAVIKSSGDNETQIIIADTPDWGLGGGGYITTVNEKTSLGPKGYEAEFNAIWIGQIDSNGVPTRKWTLANGNPVLYYATGCIRPDLCVHMNAKQSEEGSFAHPDNSWQLDKFEQFVNSLKMSTGDTQD